MSVFYRIIYIIFKWPFRWLFNIHVHGKMNEPDKKQGAFLLCSNHMSNLDPVVLCDALRYWQPHYMAKSELFKFPPLGWFIRAFGAFPIHRDRADVSAIKTAIDLMHSGKMVCIFPQGHRRKGMKPEDTHIMPGAGWIADKAQVTVLPVLIKTKDYKPRLFRRIDVYINKPVTVNDWKDIPESQSRNMEITKLIFSRICNADKEVS